MAEPELYPVRVGGYIVAYRPKTTADTKKSTAKKQATSKGSASKAEEATR